MNEIISERARTVKGKIETFNREFAPEVTLNLILSDHVIDD